MPAEFQRQGIGKSLVGDLETEIKKRGGITLWVGTDDENCQTSLGRVDIYQKCGFTIVGVMPDANGIGKPDIYMAKSQLVAKEDVASNFLTALEERLNQ